MITLLVSDFKQISQEVYDREIFRLQFHQLTCPSCGHSACLSVHGYYHRSVHTPTGLVRLRILRVRCSCGRTHSILLSSMVPYSRLPLLDHVFIASRCRFSDSLAPLQSKIPVLSEWTIRYVWNSFHRSWKQRLLSEGIPLDPVPDLVQRSFHCFSRQFLQNHCGANILFSQTT